MALDWHLIARENGFPDPKAMLEKLYVEEGYSIHDIASHLQCSSWSVRYAMGRFEVPPRSQGGMRRKHGAMSPETIESLLSKLKGAAS